MGHIDYFALTSMELEWGVQSQVRWSQRQEQSSETLSGELLKNLGKELKHFCCFGFLPFFFFHMYC